MAKWAEIKCERCAAPPIALWDALARSLEESDAREARLEAKLEKAVRLIEHAIELGRWDLNPSFRDEMIGFTTELKGQDDE